MDVRDAGELDRFIDFAVQKLGGIDIIVNNAGGAHPGSGETLDDDALLADYNIKVLSWQRIIRRTLPYLRQSDQARIITIGSVYQHSPDYRFFSTSVHRAAGANLTQAWAAELAKDNILVNSINIGCIHTPPVGQHPPEAEPRAQHPRIPRPHRCRRHSAGPFW